MGLAPTGIIRTFLAESKLQIYLVLPSSINWQSLCERILEVGETGLAVLPLSREETNALINGAKPRRTSIGVQPASVFVC